ncbi:hypothetical protein LshimejAT787_1900550 [Lyophyllum shimeji]|uniref:DUF6533 domain-containing protein n=1 Tax=Lyophyllum shimeji TaxID=47721 RepID=A0A9P3PXQ8_LYOSH|nr:hypothetical protein LshimejAT787_1900550 [Lyophyllum shimeji]
MSDVGDEAALLNEYMAVRYTNVAFLMLLLYDHALTFDLEVERIWTLPWRLPKVLFLLNRYIIPPMLLFDGLVPSIPLGEGNPTDARILNYFIVSCRFITRWTAWPTIFAMTIVDGILVLRVIAIYGHDKRVTRFLVILCTGVWGIWLGLSILIVMKTAPLPVEGKLFTGCLYTAPSYFYAAWIPASCFETIIIALTTYKVVKYDTMTPTLYVLARDSMLYFISIFIVLLVNLFLARYARGFLSALLIQPGSAIACVAAARMTMNIREFTMNKDPQATDFELPPINLYPYDAVPIRQSGERGDRAIIPHPHPHPHPLALLPAGRHVRERAA